jgi:hypothetical protein
MSFYVCTRGRTDQRSPASHTRPRC